MKPKCAPIVNGCEFSPTLGTPSVHIDNAKAAYEAMDHLYGLGHRRIGVVTGPLVSPLSRDRLDGATARAKEKKAERNLIVVQGDFSIESGAAAAERLLARAEPPTAIFCFMTNAMGVIEWRGSDRCGARDLAVVGFDEIRFARIRIRADDDRYPCARSAKHGAAAARHSVRGDEMTRPPRSPLGTRRRAREHRPAAQAVNGVRPSFFVFRNDYSDEPCWLRKTKKEGLTPSAGTLPSIRRRPE